MQVSGIKYVTPFKGAQVDNPSPLISGNWAYLTKPNDSVQISTQNEEQPKKSSLLKKTLYTVAGLGLVAGAFAWARNTKGISEVMSNSKTMSDAQGFTNKVKYLIGKTGDGVKSAWNNTFGKMKNWFSKAEKADASKAAEKTAESAEAGAKKGAESVAENATKNAGKGKEQAVQQTKKEMQKELRATNKKINELSANVKKLEKAKKPDKKAIAAAKKDLAAEQKKAEELNAKINPKAKDKNVPGKNKVGSEKGGKKTDSKKTNTKKTDKTGTDKNAGNKKAEMKKADKKTDSKNGVKGAVSSKKAKGTTKKK